MGSIRHRNQQIVQLRKQRISRRDVASKFGLSVWRIGLIEREFAADNAMAERRAKLRKEIQTADDPERLWAVNDLADAIGLIVVTKKRLLDHFRQAGKEQISLRELMDMSLQSPVEGLDFMMTPLLRVRGIGSKGFWSLVNGLTKMDLGGRCNEAWHTKLVNIKQQWRITGETPYFSTPS